MLIKPNVKANVSMIVPTVECIMYDKLYKAGAIREPPQIDLYSGANVYLTPATPSKFEP